MRHVPPHTPPPISPHGPSVVELVDELVVVVGSSVLEVVVVGSSVLDVVVVGSSVLDVVVVGSSVLEVVVLGSRVVEVVVVVRSGIHTHAGATPLQL